MQGHAVVFEHRRIGTGRDVQKKGREREGRSEKVLKRERERER